MQDLQANLNSTQDPGLNGGSLSEYRDSSLIVDPPVADELGEGSTQASGEAANLGKDGPFWDALNAQVLSLHGVISGHGTWHFLELIVCRNIIALHRSRKRVVQARADKERHILL